jgi:serine/threonine-protein kinase
VQVFDTGTLDDGTPYIAMELLRGETLQNRVHRAGPIPVAEGVEILAQCCKALSRAHAAGIIHRDIKPDNIFLAHSNDDEGSVAKILDFGIAKMSASVTEQGSKQGATRTGAVLGTPLYMSPEQARGLRTLDKRTDLYSLGLVAYTMFTGNLAFSSESFGDLLYQICTAPLPSLCGNAAWLPPALEGWFQRACAREPKDRYASAQDFAEALRLAADVTLQPPGSSFASAPSGTPFGDPAAHVVIVSSPWSGPGTGSGVSRTDGPGSKPTETGKRWLVLAVVGASFFVVGGAIVAAIALSPKSGSFTARAAHSDSVSATALPSSVSSATNAALIPTGAAPGSPTPAAAAEGSAPARQEVAPTPPGSPQVDKAAAGLANGGQTAPHASSHAAGHKNPPPPPPPAAAATKGGAVDLGY